MTHKFDYKKSKNLISDKRKKLLPAGEILFNLGLKKGDIIADIGSGVGYFTFPASKIVGSEGTVYAMDISSEMLNEIEKVIKDKHIFNIKVVKTTESSLLIDDDSVGFVFTSFVLHEVDELDSTLQEIKRIMVHDGRIAIIEWKKVKSDFGPPAKHRLDPNILVEKLKEFKFRNIKIYDLNEYFYKITGFK